MTSDGGGRVRVLVVVGTRPEAIKLAPVIRALRADPERIEARVCATAQHREMLDDALALFGVRPDHDLDVMRPGQTLAATAAAVLRGMERVLEAERPDWVVVQGDTTTVAATALAAFFGGCRVAHVEAGLRTGDKQNPFPEEVNRRVASVAADLHFAPTESARANLLGEGIEPDTVLVTGNPVIDAVRWLAGTRHERGWSAPELEALEPELESGRLVLVTAHRRENFGGPLEDICGALRDLAERVPDARIVYPVHPNPRVRQTAEALLSDVPNLWLLPPVDYGDFVRLMASAELILTDSGGIQEEAPALGVPVLVLREVTERPEALEYGGVRLVGTDRGRVLAAALSALESADRRPTGEPRPSPYGDGRAGERIAAALRGERDIAPFRAAAPAALAEL